MRKLNLGPLEEQPCFQLLSHLSMTQASFYQIIFTTIQDQNCEQWERPSYLSGSPVKVVCSVSLFYFSCFYSFALLGACLQAPK